MKKKILTIELVNGELIKRDITHEKIAPIGAPVNDVAYAQYCLGIAVNGWNHPDTSEKYLKWVAPSQIKSVEIKLSES